MQSHNAIRTGRNLPRVAVITASCGGKWLRRAIASVENQTYPRVHHYIVADGPERLARVKDSAGKLSNRATVLATPAMTGANGFNGHRIYGGIPFLINEEFVCYLDDDNYFAPSHLQKLIQLVQRHSLDWAYSLRQIVGQNGKFLCYDDCDSLGIWGSWYGNQNHIDTNCYLLKRELAIEAASIWYRRGYDLNTLDPDKALCRWLLTHHIRGFTTGLYTVYYRIGSSQQSVKKDYFEYGNLSMKGLYRRFPWRRPLLEAVAVNTDYRRIVSLSEPGAKKLRRKLKGSNFHSS